LSAACNDLIRTWDNAGRSRCPFAERGIRAEHRLRPPDAAQGAAAPSGHPAPALGALQIRPRDVFRHAPNVTAVIAPSFIFPRSPWNAHSGIPCSARPARGVMLPRHRAALRSYNSGPMPSCSQAPSPGSGRRSAGGVADRKRQPAVPAIAAAGCELDNWPRQTATHSFWQVHRLRHLDLRSCRVAPPGRASPRQTPARAPGQRRRLES
jgi:hypothetical protein